MGKPREVLWLYNESPGVVHQDLGHQTVLRWRRTRSCRQGAWTSRDLANSWSKDGSQGADHVGLGRARGKCGQCKVQGVRRGTQKACSSCPRQRQRGEGSRARAHLMCWRGRWAPLHPWASQPDSPCRWPPGEDGEAVHARKRSIEVGGRANSGACRSTLFTCE